MNYISTIAFKDNIDDYIQEFANSKYGIEFSSGGLPHNFNNFKLFESFTGKKIIHNYFPGYKNDPFVLNIASLNEIIKKSVVKVKRCERPSDLEVSGHSLRVGAAQDLLIKGYDLAAIMRAGGWSNAETVSRYLRFSQHNIWA